MGRPRPHPALPSRAAGSAAAACQCGLIGLILRGQQSDLDHSACRWSLEPLRRWEVRAGGTAAGEAWGVGLVSAAPGLELSLGPECVCLPGSVSMSLGGWAACLCVSLWVLGS